MNRYLVALLVVAAACAKSDVERRRDIANCSEASSDALEIGLCLETRYGWKEAEAGPAATTRARELDSIEAWVDDSIWALAGARRQAEVRACAGADLSRCLLVRFGWPEPRTVAAAESVWIANGATHRKEVEACSRQRDSSVGSCLMLRYKWPTERALALDDSIQRARMR